MEYYIVPASHILNIANGYGGNTAKDLLMKLEGFKRSDGGVDQKLSPYVAPGLDNQIAPVQLCGSVMYQTCQLSNKVNELVRKVNSGGLMISEEELTRRVIEFMKPTQEELFLEFLEKSRKEGFEKTFNNLGGAEPQIEIKRIVDIPIVGDWDGKISTIASLIHKVIHTVNDLITKSNNVHH